MLLHSLPAACGCGGMAPRTISPTSLIRRPPMLRPDLRQSRTRITIANAAAADAGGPSDPYQVLGLKPGADSERVQRAYRRAMNDAERAGNKSRVEQLEAAHTSIMMSGLSARLQGGGSVAKDIKYADKAVFFPWRPRKWVAEAKFIQIVAGAQALLAAWATLTSATAGTQPLIASTLVGVVGNAYKQSMIFPAPTSPTATNKNQTFKNLARAALLTCMATFLGCFLLFTLPDAAATMLTGRPLPVWFYQKETILLCVGTAACNFLFSAFLR